MLQRSGYNENPKNKVIEAENTVKIKAYQWSRFL